MNVLKTRQNLEKRRNSVDLEDAHVLDQSDPACRLERTCKLIFFCDIFAFNKFHIDE